MKTIQVTLQERWAASKHQVHKSKKSYTRKDKHKKKGPHQDPSFFYHLVVGITYYRNKRTGPSTLPPSNILAGPVLPTHPKDTNKDLSWQLIHKVFFKKNKLKKSCFILYNFLSLGINN